ncbi:MAG: MOSC domain-containing protein [Stappiaceae bacterium]
MSIPTPPDPMSTLSLSMNSSAHTSQESPAMPPLPDLNAEIIALFVGRVEERWPGKPSSAIGKKPTHDALHLEETGFTEDSQADLKVHGGPEKAVHHYAADHMAHWRTTFPDNADSFVPGCFGENVSTTGLNEQNLCLGDTLKMGSATVQICQGRQPCWKLNAHTGISQMAAAFQRTAFTGWYYRVLQQGTVRAGDVICLIERPCPDLSLDRLIRARFDPVLSPDFAAELAGQPHLSQSWRAAFAKKQARGFKENTDARLMG